MVSIRPIIETDWSAIERIQRACYPPSALESLACLQSLAELSPTTCFAAASDTHVGAYLLAHPWSSDDLPPLDAPLMFVPPGANALFIHDLALMPEFRGTGLAHQLIRHAIDGAHALGLSSASLLSVQGTAAFWKRFGFIARPELTARFHATVTAFYQIEFEFMTVGTLPRAGDKRS